MNKRRRSRRLRERCWSYLFRTKAEKIYHEKCRILDEVGIDYRVWMDDNQADLLFINNPFPLVEITE